MQSIIDHLHTKNASDAKNAALAIHIDSTATFLQKAPSYLHDYDYATMSKYLKPPRQT